MGKKAKVAAFGLSAFVLLALAAGGYWLLRRTEPDICRICQREIHAQSRAIVEMDGKRERVCCVRCELTLEVQQHKPVRLMEVTDYASTKPLSPAAAYFVEGSRIVLCEKHEPLLDETKQPHPRVFDRCEPSLYAFARREDAEAFARENGGFVLRLADVMKEVEGKP